MNQDADTEIEGLENAEELARALGLTESRNSPRLYRGDTIPGFEAGKPDVTPFVDFREEKGDPKGRRYVKLSHPNRDDEFSGSEEDFPKILMEYKRLRDKYDLTHDGSEDQEPGDTVEVVNDEEEKSKAEEWVEEQRKTIDDRFPTPESTTSRGEEASITPTSTTTRLGAPDAQALSNAQKTARILTDIIDENKLYANIHGNKYVNIEGWQALGGLLHCTSEIVSVERFEEDGWRARARVLDPSGEELASAESICTRGEDNWSGRDEYALFSMSQTRAMGKAYRLAFGWIIQLAGYSPTPAEEMPRGESK